MSQPKLFSKVRCKAYMAKANDSVRIELYDRDGNLITSNNVRDYKATATAYRYDPDKNEEVEIAGLSAFCGEGVEKTYRERKEDEFTGILVGYTTVKCKGIIGTDWNSDEHYDYGYCFKSTTYAPKLGVVYFKNNCKRYVLPEDMTEIEN